MSSFIARVQRSARLPSEYGVSEVTIYKWIRLTFPIEGASELTAAEVAAIQKGNLRLKQEVEILNILTLVVQTKAMVCATIFL